MAILKVSTCYAQKLSDAFEPFHWPRWKNQLGCEGLSITVKRRDRSERIKAQSSVVWPLCSCPGRLGE